MGVWKDIREAYSSREEVPLFTNGQMITYFVTRTVSDGLPAGDFKGMNEKAKRLYECGHVQRIMVQTSHSLHWFRAECLPEMKKDIVYKVVLSISRKSFDIEHARCGCKAGIGPKASCKHV